MHVAVDARTVHSPQRRGTGKNLIDLYGGLAHACPSWRFTMFCQRRAAVDPFGHLPNVTTVEVDIRGDAWNLWQMVRLPLAARSIRADLLHSPANTAPPALLTPSVVTIHDLIPFEMAPEAPETRRWLSRVRRSARTARRIITPSAYSKRLIVEHLGVPDLRVVVNPWAPDRAMRRVDDADALQELRTRMGLSPGGRYVLAFGAADPRKNTARIIRAWQGLDVATRRGAVLLVVGLQAEALAGLEPMRDDTVHLRGFVAEGDMPALMTGATALCYPSLSEGFGLPILDAFECGTPVITSSTTSLPEVAGDAALLVNPQDEAAIGEAMAQLLQDEALRQSLIDAGSRRKAHFTWERCVATARDTFERAAADDRRFRTDDDRDDRLRA